MIFGVITIVLDFSIRVPDHCAAARIIPLVLGCIPVGIRYPGQRTGIVIGVSYYTVTVRRAAGKNERAAVRANHPDHIAAIRCIAQRANYGSGAVIHRHFIGFITKINHICAQGDLG